MFAVLLAATTAVAAPDPDVLEKTADWKAPSVADVQAQALAYLKEQQADADALAKATELWTDVPEEPTGDAVLTRLAATLALVNRDVAELIKFCSKPNTRLVQPERPWLTDEKTPELVAANMRLLYGRWLVHQELFDEGLEQLTDLEPGEVVAPALLLFYQGVAHHTLLEKDAGLKVIDKLLDGAEQSPRRYVAVAQLMQQDLEGLEDDTLDHIARRMKDVRRRLNLGRGGKKVKDVEDGVIKSLDKLIKKLEEQQKQQGGGGGGMQDNIQSSRPAPDSMPIGGLGPGNVDRKPIGAESGWGDLPPREREEAMHALGRDFPPSYRAIIEQYFRKLAEQESK